jgi:hypothetical protein
MIPNFFRVRTFRNSIKDWVAFQGPFLLFFYYYSDMPLCRHPFFLSIWKMHLCKTHFQFKIFFLNKVKNYIRRQILYREDVVMWHCINAVLIVETTPFRMGLNRFFSTKNMITSRMNKVVSCEYIQKWFIGSSMFDFHRKKNQINFVYFFRENKTECIDVSC